MGALLPCAADKIDLLDTVDLNDDERRLKILGNQFNKQVLGDDVVAAEKTWDKMELAVEALQRKSIETGVVQ